MLRSIVYSTPFFLALLLTALAVLVSAFGSNSLERTAIEIFIRITMVVGMWVFIGNSGVISMWVKSVEDWDNLSRARVFFDASIGDSNQFYGVVTAAGQLKFSINDDAGNEHTITTATAYTFSSSTWVHVAFSWNMGNNEQDIGIWVNGVTAKYESTIGTEPVLPT